MRVRRRAFILLSYSKVMGGKNRHSQDRLFITATEWRNEHGGKKRKQRTEHQPIDFDKCALSMSSFKIPCCLEEGVIFEYAVLKEFLEKYKANPVSGAESKSEDILRLNMVMVLCFYPDATFAYFVDHRIYLHTQTKNQDGLWHCPVTCKVFTNNSHVVAIKTTGNVFSYQAVQELNIRTKNYTDLLTGEKFSKADIITLQDPTDEGHISLRDVNNFRHLKELQMQSSSAGSGSIRKTVGIESTMKEIEREKFRNKNVKNLITNEISKPSEEEVKDIAQLWSLSPLLKDVIPGNEETGHAMSTSLTSSTIDVSTKSVDKLATPREIRNAKCKAIRSLKKKAYVQLQTSVGAINVELHCDMTPRTCWNFIELCNRGYYDETVFHRLIPGFMVQGGDPKGDGTGGESMWGTSFEDEFDSRLHHDKRGVLSMANRGPNSNGSQFFITFKPASHLDNVHTVFGVVVGGMATVDLMESIGGSEKGVPKQEIKILKTVIFQSPLDEADGVLLDRIQGAVKARKAVVDRKTNALPNTAASSASLSKIKSPAIAPSSGVGKYLDANRK